MLALEKIAAAFLTFPGIFLLVWGTVTVYLIIRRSSILIRLLAVVTLAVMIIIFTGFGTGLFLMPLEGNHQPGNNLAAGPYPIVVMGGGIHYLEEGTGELTAFSLQRLVKGYQLYRRYNTPLIYSGGVAIGQERLSEAEVAEEWLERMGVPGVKIIKEDRARTTYENGLYIRAWLEEQNYQKIYLVTSAVHLKRSAAVFHKLGIEYIPVPAGYQYSQQLGWLDYLPNRAALTANLNAVHEWLGLIWYWLRGRI